MKLCCKSKCIIELLRKVFRKVKLWIAGNVHEYIFVRVLTGDMNWGV